MKFILLSEDILFQDNCEKCQSQTQHACRFSEYDAQYHDVTYYIWCRACYKRDGEDCEVDEFKRPVMEWVNTLAKMLGENQNLELCSICFGFVLVRLYCGGADESQALCGLDERDWQPLSFRVWSTCRCQ